jgi:hypothetical protein
MIDAFKRLPNCARDIPRKMLAGFKANYSIAAPMHH